MQSRNVKTTQLSASLECGGLAPLCYRSSAIGPKRCQAAALQGGLTLLNGGLAILDRSARQRRV